MKTVYIVLLANTYLKFFRKKPEKKGNYLKDVRLFECDGKVTCNVISDWVQKKYAHTDVKEVTDWI